MDEGVVVVRGQVRVLRLDVHSQWVVVRAEAHLQSAHKAQTARAPWMGCASEWDTGFWQGDNCAPQNGNHRWGARVRVGPQAEKGHPAVGRPLRCDVWRGSAPPPPLWDHNREGGGA